MQAEIVYTRDSGEKLVNETFGPNNIRRRTTGAGEMQRVEIANGREAGAMALETNGFMLVEHRTAVRDFFDADELLKGRFAIVQVWRAAYGDPAERIVSNPLAMADARSVAPDDLLVAERRYPHRVGQTYRLKYSPRHRWFYFPQMQRNQAIVFKVFDSLKDGRARFTPHTSFDDPSTPRGAPPRQSVEARTLAFF